MCGIIGYVGNDNKAIKKTISCLEKLEYRGYDSAGIAYVENKNIIIKKELGRIRSLKKELDYNIDSNVAIAHTRWATHGSANKVNAHPHKVGSVTIVHNGIIENYLELKEMLIKEGYEFKSETDTEVACATIDYVCRNEKDKVISLSKLSNLLKGSYALGILFDDEPDTIYALRKDSPLIVGIENSNYFISSDIPALLEYTNKYILLDNDDIVKLNSEYSIYHNNEEVKKEIKIFDFELSVQDKGNYEHFMLKEINEQSNIIYNLFNTHLNNNLINIPNVSNYDRIDIVGCGSAYHTGLIAKSIFEDYLNKEINCYVASEYRYNNNFFGKKSLVIFISQSGETADTLACLRKVKSKGIKTLGIVNAFGSTIAREADEVIYTNAGVEVAVATTKAYTAQLAILSLIAIKYALNNNIRVDLDKIKSECLNIGKVIDNLINDINYLNIAKQIYKRKDIFFIGRLIDYAISLEGALKLKEISYINSSTYPAGELKHGTISLIEDNTPVISVITNENIKDKTISNIKEVKARHAFSVVITSLDIDEDVADILIRIPKYNKYIEPIITIIPLQLLAYNVAKLNNCDIDKPRNLAKSVTVE